MKENMRRRFRFPLNKLHLLFSIFMFLCVSLFIHMRKHYLLSFMGLDVYNEFQCDQGIERMVLTSSKTSLRTSGVAGMPMTVWERDHEVPGIPIATQVGKLKCMLKNFSKDACKDTDDLIPQFPIEPIVKICNDIIERKRINDPTHQCWVFSFGIAYNFIFDNHMLSKGCNVRSFDPSMKPGDYTQGPGHKFFAIGLGIHDGVETLDTSTLYSKQAHFPVRTLETLMKIEDIDHLDVVRIDIEGAEWRVLFDFFKKGLHKKVDQILLEIHLWNNIHSYESVFRVLHMLLVDSGMRLFWAQPNGDDPHRLFEIGLIW